VFSTRYIKLDLNSILFEMPLTHPWGIENGNFQNSSRATHQVSYILLGRCLWNWREGL